ncbi:hypothetical protein SAMN04515671_2790 [Nakamurella panacisegetis]|uniref:4-amino-4-deoxy-L-arabinose transferase n=1 Tax=Nakamurella panacisegetis TaxID=1090615 RepID=A0A1H0PJK8_9ACTN|nr:hypothetical protein [Nakamurella panacisegetis]SDP04828.1 hypothetical protein SAMN04515671_2790 [Nakamurella panacisegetis]
MNGAPAEVETETGPSQTAEVAPTRPIARRAWPLYLYSALLTAGCVTWMMRLWQADLKVPFFSSGNAAVNAGLFKTIAATGWYSNQSELGIPYGQHNVDLATPGTLNVLLARLLTAVTPDWAVAFNVFYLLGFLLCALTAVCFFRAVGLGRWMTVVASVLLAVAPYHFLQGQDQIWLSAYFCVPLAMVLILWVARGESLWGLRPGSARLGRALLGRGAATVSVLLLIALDGLTYALFTGLLLAAAGIFGLVRRFSAARLLGLVAAEAVLVLVVLGDSLPHLLRPAVSEPVVALVHNVSTEYSELKFASLVFPSPGHPIAYFAKWRRLYDLHYPDPGNTPALGLIGAAGFALLLLLGLTALTGLRRPADPTPAQVRRRRTLGQLAALVITAFALSMIGGLGSLISRFAGHFAGWDNMAIFIAVLALAAAALAVEAVADRLSCALRDRSAGARRPALLAGVTPMVAVAVLLFGIWDQGLSGAIPAYRSNLAVTTSDRAFVAGIAARVPADAAIFQIPAQTFPTADAPHLTAAVNTGSQLRLWLSSSGLRWSGGGITGRPQADWPSTVTALPPAEMVRDLAAIGFAGITVDRAATTDHGRQWERTLAAQLGRPALVSRDLNYVYYSLARAARALRADTTAAQRAAIATAITGEQQP